MSKEQIIELICNCYIYNELSPYYGLEDYLYAHFEDFDFGLYNSMEELNVSSEIEEAILDLTCECVFEIKHALSVATSGIENIFKTSLKEFDDGLTFIYVDSVILLKSEKAALISVTADR